MGGNKKRQKGRESWPDARSEVQIWMLNRTWEFWHGRCKWRAKRKGNGGGAMEESHAPFWVNSCADLSSFGTVGLTYSSPFASYIFSWYVRSSGYELLMHAWDRIIADTITLQFKNGLRHTTDGVDPCSGQMKKTGTDSDWNNIFGIGWGEGLTKRSCISPPSGLSWGCGIHLTNSFNLYTCRLSS